MANELARINHETMAATVQSLPEVTAWIQRNHDKGLAKGQAILDTLEASGMTAEMYAEVGEYIELAKKCKTMMMDKRSPITQLMDSYRKVFTSLEADFDVNNASSIPGKLKAARDQYAAQEARKRQEAARAAQNEALAAQALETYKQGVKGEIRQRLDYLCSECAKCLKKQFDALTLKNYFAIKTYIENFKEELTRGMLLGNLMDECHVPVPQNLPNGLSTNFEALKEVRKEVYLECESEMMIAFSVYAKKQKQNYIDILPQKKEQLELAEKDAEAAKARAEEIRRKQEEDAARAEKERQEASQKEAQKAGMEAQQRIAMGLFAGMEQPQSDIKTKTKKVLRISSKNAFLSLLNYWWLNEGQELTIDELSKTFKKMITYAEKRANAKDPEFVTGDGIKFEDEITAK